jgi:SAM-dependent methyltransferase
VSSEATYERLAALLEPAEDELLQMLAPQEGERVLDLVTGSGAIALRAAQAGAEVVAIDSTEPILARLRQDGADLGVEIEARVADVEYLPFDEGCFDVLVSNFGLVYAPDHANVAAELARVACPSARLGFTAWRPNPKLTELYRSFTDEPIDGREAYEWGREDHVEDMLGEHFELDFHDGTLWVDAASGQELWELFSTTATPVISVLKRLDQEGAKNFERAFVDLYEEYRTTDGIRAPRRYLLVLGRRR